MSINSDDLVEYKDDLPIVISKDEMNLAEFPFALLSRRARTGQKTIEVSQQVRDRRGRVVKQEWIVTGSDKYGLPLAIDEDVYIALMQLYKDSDFVNRYVHFSRYQMLRIMGKETSKRGYDRIQSALNRLVSVTVVSKNAFWDNNAKQYVSEAFHLFDSYRLYDERSSEKGQDQQSLPLSNVVMSEFLFNSIKAGYIKDLNTKFYFGLETPLSKRLYRYLDKKRYHKSTFEIRLLKLAALLPIQDKYLSQIKRRLGKAHDELIKKGFLQNVSYENTSDNDEEKVIYIFSQASLTKSKETDLSVTTSKIQSENRKQEDEEPSLEQQLVDRGVTKIVAAGLAKKYPTQEVEKQIDIFDWLLKIRSPLLEKNPAGFLRKSIEENYEPPADYLNWQKREIVKREREQEAIEKEAEQSKLDEIQRQVDEYRDQLSEHDRELLHKEAIELIENDENIKKEFVSEFLIRAFEAEIIKKKLGI